MGGVVPAVIYKAEGCQRMGTWKDREEKVRCPAENFHYRRPSE